MPANYNETERFPSKTVDYLGIFNAHRHKQTNMKINIRCKLKKSDVMFDGDNDGERGVLPPNFVAL